MAADFIPTREADFDSWLKFLIQYVDEKCGGNRPEWTHILSEARNIVSDAYAAWETAYEKTKGRRLHTQVNTEAKNDAEAAAKAVVRPFISRYPRFPPVKRRSAPAEKPTLSGNPDRVGTARKARGLCGHGLLVTARSESECSKVVNKAKGNNV
jgi:hypothetical protein